MIRILLVRESLKNAFDPMPSSLRSDSTRPADADAGEPGDSGSSVYIRFSPSQGPRLRQSGPTAYGSGSPLWAERPILMQRADSTYELIGTSHNLEGLARWVLSHGVDAEVRGSDALRRRVIAEARRIVQRYKVEKETPSDM